LRYFYQEQEGMKRVISYASRGLNKAEKNYPPHKREFLALKWSICDKFKDYLYGLAQVHVFFVLDLLFWCFLLGVGIRSINGLLTRLKFLINRM
jgi:hypothetical protein